MFVRIEMSLHAHIDQNVVTKLVCHFLRTGSSRVVEKLKCAMATLQRPLSRTQGDGFCFANAKKCTPYIGVLCNPINVPCVYVTMMVSGNERSYYDCTARDFS